MNFKTLSVLFSFPWRLSEDHFEGQKVIWGHFSNLANFVKPKTRAEPKSVRIDPY